MQGTHAPPHKQTYGFDYGNSQYYGGNRQPNNVSYNNNVSIEYIDERDKENKVVNRCARTILLVFVGIFSVAALALGIASVVAEPWWTYEENSGLKINIGLWKACVRENKDGDFDCRDYSSDKSPYNDMDILQYCMIAGVAVSGVAFILLVVCIVLVIFRKTRAFRILLYLIAFLALVSVTLCCVAIGYAVEVTEISSLTPAFMTSKITANKKANESTMFYLACAAAGCIAMVCIVSGVYLFIADDEYENEDDDSEAGYVRSNSFNYGQTYDIEREISRRGKHLVNREPSNDMAIFMHAKNNKNGVHKYNSPEFYEHGKSGQTRNGTRHHNGNYRDSSESYPKNRYGEFNYNTGELQNSHRNHQMQLEMYGQDEEDRRKQKSPKKKNHKTKHAAPPPPYMSYGQQRFYEASSLNLPREQRREIPPTSVYLSEPRNNKLERQPRESMENGYAHRAPIGLSYHNDKTFSKRFANHPDYPEHLQPSNRLNRLNTDPEFRSSSRNNDGYDKYFDSPY